MTKIADIPEFGPCSGIKVIVVAPSVAGPFAASLFADFGASVISIENPQIPEMSRNQFGNTYQAYWRNQRTLTLDIPSPEGREVFFKLIADSDIFIEASAGGHWDKWGLSDEVLWEHNPRLVIAHISGFGQTGDPYYSKRGSMDPIAQAFGCYMSLNGFPDRSPIPAMIHPVDHLCGAIAFGLCTAAMRRAEITGKGESIDMAQYEIAMRCQSWFPMDYINNGQLYKAEGNHGPTAGYGLYKCKDGYVMMLVVGIGAIKNTIRLLGLESRAELYPATQTVVYLNTEAGDLFEEEITAFCAEHTAEEAERAFVGAKVACSRVMNYPEAEFNSHYIERGVWAEWDCPDGVRRKGVGVLPHLKNFPGQIWRGAPTIGLDNEDVLSEIGMSEEKVAELYENGIISKRENTERPDLYKQTRDWQKITKERLGQ